MKHCSAINPPRFFCFHALRAVPVVAVAWLLTVSLSAASWQHVNAGGSVRAIAVHDGEFVAVLASGSILFSPDARQWEERGAIARGGRVFVFDHGLTVFNVDEHVDGSRTATIRHAPDFLNFDLRLERPVPENPVWDGSLVEVGTGWIAILNGHGYGQIVHSPDGVTWESVYESDGERLGPVYRTASGGLAVERFGTSPLEWLETEDGISWWLHNRMVGRIAYFHGRYVGVPTGSAPIAVSEDGVTWTDLPVEMVAGPRALVQAPDRLAIINAGRTVWISNDGIEWTPHELPPPRIEVGFLIGRFGYFEGRFWMHRELSSPPGGPFDGMEHVEVWSSPDGVAWEFEGEELPPGYQNEGNSEVIEHAPLPPDRVHISLLETSVPTSVHQGDVTARIGLIPEGTRYGLYLSTNGEESLVNSNWGTSQGLSDRYPYAAVRNLVGLNGVFLARNNLGYLGYHDTGVAHLPQPVARVARPFTEYAIELEWNAVPEAVLYRVHRTAGQGLDGLAVIGETASTGWIDDAVELEKGQTYGYAIAAHAEDGRESFPGWVTTGRLWSLDSYWSASMAGGFGGDMAGDAAHWANLDWIGRLYVKSAPWVWSENHGWWYLHETRIGFWAWDTALEWLWSSRDLYPYVHHAAGDRWLYYIDGSREPRWFVDVAENRWFADAP